ncbi:hypothetical protein HUJ05_008044 [Dendroctonus ponderosae]|nr:hypothetical protein HUJ05_008044 [Dendroctonus ponderosae]
MDVEQLIQQIQTRTPIWDQKNSLYHNRELVAKLWEEVATTCELTGNSPHRNMHIFLACHAWVQTLAIIMLTIVWNPSLSAAILKRSSTCRSVQGLMLCSQDSFFRLIHLFPSYPNILLIMLRQSGKICVTVSEAN